MKLGILTAIYGRYDIFETFKKGIERLKEHTDIEIEVVVVGSEGKKSSNAASKYNYIAHKNKPLSNKWNKGMLKMKELNVDYVLCLGSDDLVSNSLIDRYIEAMRQGYDFIGLLDCFIYDTKTKDLRFWTGYNGIRIGETAGIARCLSSRILSDMDWKPWGEAKERGLDGEMFKKLKDIKHVQKLFGCLKDNIFAVDLKDENSMTGFEHFSKFPKFKKELMFNQCPETNE